MKSFEERMARLEEISEQINQGNLPLAQSVALFEEGITLSRGLEDELNALEGKVEILINQPDPDNPAEGESPQTAPFTGAPGREE